MRIAGDERALRRCKVSLRGGIVGAVRADLTRRSPEPRASGDATREAIYAFTGGAKFIWKEVFYAH